MYCNMWALWEFKHNVGVLFIQRTTCTIVDQFMSCCVSDRACLDQHLIDRRYYAAITCDQVQAWSWSLVADSHSAERFRSQSSAVQTRTHRASGGHPVTVINCTVLHAAWRGGWEMLQRQQPVKPCTAVGSCREDELKRIILPDWLQWRPATRDVGIMVACGVALDVQLFVTRRH